MYNKLYATLSLGRNATQTCQSTLTKTYSQKYICAAYVWKKRKRITGFYISRQVVPEGRSSEGYASFKQVKPWPWHVQVIPGVSGIEGLVTNKELFQIVWGFFFFFFFN